MYDKTPVHSKLNTTKEATRVRVSPNPGLNCPQTLKVTIKITILTPPKMKTHETLKQDYIKIIITTTVKCHLKT